MITKINKDINFLALFFLPLLQRMRMRMPLYNQTDKKIFLAFDIIMDSPWLNFIYFSFILEFKNRCSFGSKSHHSKQLYDANESMVIICLVFIRLSRHEPIRHMNPSDTLTSIDLNHDSDNSIDGSQITYPIFWNNYRLLQLNIGQYQGQDKKVWSSFFFSK